MVTIEYISTVILVIYNELLVVYISLKSPGNMGCHMRLHYICEFTKLCVKIRHIDKLLLFTSYIILSTSIIK